MIEAWNETLMFFRWLETTDRLIKEKNTQLTPIDESGTQLLMLHSLILCEQNFVAMLKHLHQELVLGRNPPTWRQGTFFALQQPCEQTHPNGVVLRTVWPTCFSKDGDSSGRPTMGNKKRNTPGDSKWPFDPLVGGHDSPLKKRHVFTIPKRSRSQNFQASNYHHSASWNPSWEATAFNRALRLRSSKSLTFVPNVLTKQIRYPGTSLSWKICVDVFFVFMEDIYI